jgi:uncharacterized protein (DUF2345 family)
MDNHTITDGDNYLNLHTNVTLNTSGNITLQNTYGVPGENGTITLSAANTTISGYATGGVITVNGAENIVVTAGGSLTITNNGGIVVINGLGGVRITDSASGGSGTFTVDSSNQLYWNSTFIA